MCDTDDGVTLDVVNRNGNLGVRRGGNGFGLGLFGLRTVGFYKIRDPSSIDM